MMTEINSENMENIATQPICADKPAGTSVRYDDDYGQIQTEVDKLRSALIDKKPVDWNRVVDLSIGILSEKSKDLQVACYLCVGLFSTQNYVGLSKGLGVVTGLIENFWETFFPETKRMRARFDYLEWMFERVGDAVTKNNPTTSENEAVKSCYELIKKISDLLKNKLGDSKPPDNVNLDRFDKKLRNPLHKHCEAIKAREAARIEVEQKKEALQMAPNLAAVEISSEDDASRVIKEARTMILRSVNFLRQANPTNPEPYRLMRGLLWADIKIPNNENGKTMIPGIPSQTAKSFNDLLSSSNWKTLLEHAELQFPKTLFWFDLQRFSDNAMTGLGGTYTEAQQAIREQTALLVRRCPGLLDLQFQDAIPFADSQTKMWVEAEVLPIISEGRQTSTGTLSGQGVDHLDETEKEARTLKGQGKLRDALALLQEGMKREQAGRNKFHWQLRLSKACMDWGHPELAMPHLENLDSEISRFSLEEWEPDLCIKVVSLLLQCQKAKLKQLKSSSPEMMKKVNELKARLCRLDVASALDAK